MKKALVFILTAVLMFAAAGTTSAASEGIKPVYVKLDGADIPFDTAPMLINNKMYAEAGQLLEALGFQYEIEAATGIIYATSEDREIQLAAGGDIVIVNGMSVDSPGEVISKDGVTLLGVRFIAKQAGYSVAWDKQTRSARLVNKGPNAEERAAIDDVFNRLLLVEASSDASGLPELFTADTPLDVQELQRQWTITKTKTTIHKKMVESYTGQSAVVYIHDETEKLSGAFFPENAAKTRYTLHKTEDGTWKIYNVEVVEMVYLDTESMYKQEVTTVPEADKAEIGKLLDDQVKATNEENADAYMETIAPSEMDELSRQALEYLFSIADQDVMVDRWAIVEYDAGGTAKLLSTLTSEVSANGQYVAIRTVSVSNLVKIDGKWLFTAEQAQVLSQEQL